MTAQLLCHVQNFVLIGSLEFRWKHNEIVKKNVAEIGPRRPSR